MKVFDKAIEVKKKDDGSFTISVRISDNSIIVLCASRPDVERLYINLVEELKQ